MKIRKLEKKDLPWLHEQLREFAASYVVPVNYPGNDYVDVVALDLARDHVFFVVENDTGPIGLIAGMVVPHILDPGTRMLAELLWWVMPEYRGSRAAAMLMNEYVAWGKKHATIVNFALADGSVGHRAMEKRGWKLQERNYFMEV